MSREAQERGLAAEKRVYQLAKQLGEVSMATPEEDYARKIDLVFKGHPIQVSCSPKSNKRRKSLEKRGIINIPAGESIPDATIVRMLLSLV